MSQQYISTSSEASSGGSMQQSPTIQSPRNVAQSPQTPSPGASSTRASTQSHPPHTGQSPCRSQSSAQISNATGRNRRKPAEPKKKHIKITREIKHFQKTTNLLIQRAPFSRAVRQVLQQYGNFRTTPEAFNALQESAETYLVHLFEDGYRCAQFRRRKHSTLKTSILSR